MMLEKSNNISKEIRMISAAMGYYGINAATFADLIGINRVNLSPILNGKSQPKKETLDKMLEVLTLKGAVFEDDGVKFPAITTKKLEGISWFLGIQEDIIATLKNHDNKELLIYGGNNKVSPPKVVENFRRIKQAGIKIREMVKEGNSYIQGDVENYRWISAKNFNNYVTITYANKVVLDIEGDNALLIINSNFAKCERDKFNEIWDLSKPLTIESTANERY